MYGILSDVDVAEETLVNEPFLQSENFYNFSECFNFIFGRNAREQLSKFIGYLSQTLIRRYFRVYLSFSTAPSGFSRFILEYMYM